MLALPLVVLYEIGLLAARIFVGNKPAADEESQAAG